ncbi:LidA-like protein [Encephalitozoon intestinalis]|nr:LidA-like protein [Encephalitozoon intestinalis]
MLLNRSLWKNVMDAERIICEECSKLYETPEEVELMGFMAEGNMKSLLKEGNIIEEEIKEYKYLECSMIPIELLLDTDKTKGRDVVKELIKQIMMGKDKGEIDHKYINEVSNAVRRRRKVEEERRLKIERELLGESKYSGARKKKKSRGGGRKKRLAAEEKKEEKEEEEEELVGAVGGVSISSDPGKSKGKQSERTKYKLHKRVTRWSKDAGKIKKELDRGKEEKWKGRRIEEIREQKEVHDIIEIVELLRSPDASKFFIDLGGDENRIQKMATATLERGGKKETGIVEVGIFKNGKGEYVIYHLMFKAIKVEEVRSVMSSLAAEKGDLPEEQMSEGEGSLCILQEFGVLL